MEWETMKEAMVLGGVGDSLFPKGHMGYDRVTGPPGPENMCFDDRGVARGGLLHQPTMMLGGWDPT